MQDAIKGEIAASVGCAASQIALAVAAGSVVVTASMPASSASKLVAIVKSGDFFLNISERADGERRGPVPI